MKERIFIKRWDLEVADGYHLEVSIIPVTPDDFFFEPGLPEANDDFDYDFASPKELFEAMKARERDNNEFSENRNLGSVTYLCTSDSDPKEQRKYEIRGDWQELQAISCETVASAGEFLNVVEQDCERVKAEDPYHGQMRDNLIADIRRTRRMIADSGLESARGLLIAVAKGWKHVEMQPMANRGMKSKADHVKAGQASKECKGTLDSISMKLKENPELRTQQIWNSFPEFDDADEEFEYDYDAEFLVYRDDDRLFQQNQKGDKRSISRRTFERYCTDVRKQLKNP